MSRYRTTTECTRCGAIDVGPAHAMNCMGGLGIITIDLVDDLTSVGLRCLVEAYILNCDDLNGCPRSVVRDAVRAGVDEGSIPLRELEIASAWENALRQRPVQWREGRRDRGTTTE